MSVFRSHSTASLCRLFFWVGRGGSLLVMVVFFNVKFYFSTFLFLKSFKFIIREFYIYMQCNMITCPHFSLISLNVPQCVLLLISQLIDIPEANQHMCRVFSWSIDKLPVASSPKENDPPSLNRQLPIAPQVRVAWGAPGIPTGIVTGLVLCRSCTGSLSYQS